MAIVNSYTRFMPTPDRTSLDAIVLAARDLLERDGLAGVTMSAVAGRVGVRAPSLYKRVESRERLIQLVAEATLTDLADHLADRVTAREILDGFRAFSHQRPAAFQLVMTPSTSTPTARREFGARASEALIRIAADLAGDDHALEGARTLTAWTTGFISMELNGVFQLGGDVDAAWEFGATRLIEAITESGSRPDAGNVSASRTTPAA